MHDEMAPRQVVPIGWLAFALCIAGILMLVGVANGYLSSFFDAIVIALLGLFGFTMIAMRMAQPDDASWLPSLVAAGFLAKMTLSTARYLVLVEYYNGSGDATGYHGSGHELVDVWRNFQVPEEMGLGTLFVEGATGLLYVPYAPTMIGGFFIYASLAFAGQLLLYAAFRRSGPSRLWKWYAIALFFIPAIAYWPSSIGKESLMLLGLGLAAYGAAVLLDNGRFAAFLPLVAGLALTGAIRAHIAALVVGSLAVAFAVSKASAGSRLSLGRKRVFTVLVVGASLVGIFFAASRFNIDLDGASATADFNEFVDNVEDNTAKGGSEVSGGLVQSPLEIPEATLRVLFRPLPNEAHNIPALASAFESLALLLIVVWRSPQIIKNLRNIRRQPYVLMCLVMTFGFVIMFSTFNNLGLLARQRSQILPFLAVVVIQLGWGVAKRNREELIPVNEPIQVEAGV